MRKEIETFDDYMADESRVSLAQREQILSEAALVEKKMMARVQGESSEGN